MAAKKDDTRADDAAVDEEADLVPKGDTATDDIADDNATDDTVTDDLDTPYADSVGEAVESVETPDPNAPPPPITPSTPHAAAQDRVGYENQVNAGAAAFAATAHAAYIDATLAGQSISLTVSDTE